MQHLRIKFCRGEEIKFISHLDIMRLWQRAINRAGMQLLYSEGFNPHPRMSLAAPLALGVTSEAELMDIVLARWSSPHSFTDTIGRQLPRGITVIQVYSTPENIPSLQSQVQYAEYQVELETEKKPEDIEEAIAFMLAKHNLLWQHQRDTGFRRYDLRPLIDDIKFIDLSSRYCTIGMKLRCSSSGSGRPEQVTAALGFENYPKLIHRTKLILKTS